MILRSIATLQRLILISPLSFLFFLAAAADLESGFFKKKKTA
jgi:hypothetical protein